MTAEDHAARNRIAKTQKLSDHIERTWTSRTGGRSLSAFAASKPMGWWHEQEEKAGVSEASIKTRGLVVKELAARETMKMQEGASA